MNPTKEKVMKVYIVIGISDYIHSQRVVIEKVFSCRKAAKEYAVDKEAKAQSRWFKVISKKLEIGNEG